MQNYNALSNALSRVMGGAGLPPERHQAVQDWRNQFRDRLAEIPDNPNAFREGVEASTRDGVAPYYQATPDSAVAAADAALAGGIPQGYYSDAGNGRVAPDIQAIARGRGMGRAHQPSLPGATLDALEQTMGGGDRFANTGERYFDDGGPSVSPERLAELEAYGPIRQVGSSRPPADITSTPPDVLAQQEGDVPRYELNKEGEPRLNKEGESLRAMNKEGYRYPPSAPDSPLVDTLSQVMSDSPQGIDPAEMADRREDRAMDLEHSRYRDDARFLPDEDRFRNVQMNAAMKAAERRGYSPALGMLQRLMSEGGDMGEMAGAALVPGGPQMRMHDQRLAAEQAQANQADATRRIAIDAEANRENRRLDIDDRKVTADIAAAAIERRRLDEERKRLTPEGQLDERKRIREGAAGTPDAEAMGVPLEDSAAAESNLGTIGQYTRRLLREFYDNLYQDRSWNPASYGGRDEFVKQVTQRYGGKLSPDLVGQWYDQEFVPLPEADSFLGRFMPGHIGGQLDWAFNGGW